MKKSLIIGVMGGGKADSYTTQIAYRLGSLIAKEGWILLNGGRKTGVMEASAKGAWDHGGITVGILPDADIDSASPYIVIPILTGMGAARNCINVLSSDAVVACPGGAGTLTEIALAIKYEKAVIFLDFEVINFFRRFGGKSGLFYVRTPEEAIDVIKRLFPLGSKQTGG